MYIDLKTGKITVAGMRKLPKRLVKFCTSSDLKYYSGNVSLKFGTLAEYGASENLLTMGSRHDPTEGKQQTHYNYSGPANNLQIGGMSLRNVGHAVISNTISVNQINEWILCMSAGPYSRKLHEQILRAPGYEYPGNPELKAFVVFDTRKLIPAIKNAARCSSENRADPNERMIWAGPVVYDKVTKNGRIPHDNYATPRPITNDEKRSDFVNLAFRKPAFFMPEKEIRILARFNAPKFPKPDAKPISLNSTKFRDAIVTKGYW